MRTESDILKALGIVVALVAAFVVAVWFPHRAEMNQIQSQIDARRQDDARQLSEVKKFEQLRKQVATLETQFASLGKSIPASTDISPLLAQLGRELAQVSLTDSEIQSETVIHGGDISVIPLTFRIRGSYSQFFDFLRAVESGDRLTRVHDVKITGTPLKRDEPLTIRLEISTFATSGGQTKP
ncbi:MAG: type 4a pilus biogenesis protein PilO [Phycisphaeraceae bacterium]